MHIEQRRARDVSKEHALRYTREQSKTMRAQMKYQPIGARCGIPAGTYTALCGIIRFIPCLLMLKFFPAVCECANLLAEYHASDFVYRQLRVFCQEFCLQSSCIAK